MEIPSIFSENLSESHPEIPLKLFENPASTLQKIILTEILLYCLGWYTNYITLNFGGHAFCKNNCKACHTKPDLLSPPWSVTEFVYDSFPEILG